MQGASSWLVLIMLMIPVDCPCICRTYKICVQDSFSIIYIVWWPWYISDSKAIYHLHFNDTFNNGQMWVFLLPWMKELALIVAYDWIWRRCRRICRHVLCQLPQFLLGAGFTKKDKLSGNQMAWKMTRIITRDQSTKKLCKASIGFFYHRKVLLWRFNSKYARPKCLIWTGFRLQIARENKLLNIV